MNDQQEQLADFYGTFANQREIITKYRQELEEACEVGVPLLPWVILANFVVITWDEKLFVFWEPD